MKKLIYINKTITAVCVTTLILTSLLTGCTKQPQIKENKEKASTKEAFLLDTVIQLKAYGEKGEEAIDAALNRIAEIDDKLSAFKEASDVSQINNNAGVSAQKVSSDTFSIIEKAVEYSNLTGGAFDLTISPIVNLWGIGTDHQKVPSQDEINSKLGLINYQDIVLDKDNSTIKLTRKNQSIDTGGITKGYAADEVKKVFENYGVKSALIDLGGNIFAMGTKPDGTPWNVGIQDPSGQKGQYVGVISVSNKSVVTSGNYERYFIQDGKRYHHIMDPKTGYPADNGVISTTIISDHSIDGDALSTSTYVLGLEKGMKLIESLDGVDAIFITQDKKVYATSGIKNNFKLTNEEFTYEKG